MSLLKKVIGAIKKIFKTPSRRKKAPKKLKTKKVRRKIYKPSGKVKLSSSAKNKKTFPKIFKRSSRGAISQAKPVKTAIKTKSLPAAIPVGEVTHYFDKIKVCVIRIDRGALKKGDRLLIEGGKGSLSQVVTSMQIENEDVRSARKGQLIGLKVSKKVFVGDKVGKL